MARRSTLPSGSWLVAEELLERGSDEFLLELRKIHDADQLGSFAPTWLNDRRTASRKLLLRYLEQPFRCFRHESLIKRLFKLSDAAGDDELMARFLVGFDRSLRRVKRKRFRADWRTRESWTEETLRVPAMTTLTRDERMVRFDEKLQAVVPRYLSPEKIAGTHLFSTATRRYLRRRAWRYFRKLAKLDGSRYVTAITAALHLYSDSDCSSGLELIDNWGLVHALFHHSPILHAKANNWVLAEGKSLSELRPAPAFLDAWKVYGFDSLLGLVGKSRCRPIRQWAIHVLREHHSSALSRTSLSTIMEWLSSDDEELSLLAVELLELSSDLSRMTTSGWIAILGKVNESVLARVCGVVGQRVDARELSMEDIVLLCCQRPSPLARLAMGWLIEKPVISDRDCQMVLRVTSAECDSARLELVKIAIDKIATSGHVSVDILLEFLDSRFEGVRDAGWNWLMATEKIRNNPELWQKLLETPYDDVRLKLVEVLESLKWTFQEEVNSHLENRSTIPDNSGLQDALIRDRIDPALVRVLWATVLLNIHRGGKQKPGVIRSIVALLEKAPDEIDHLLPLLRTALRSVRVGEWRTALAGLVRLVELRPELTARIQSQFPELAF